MTPGWWRRKRKTKTRVEWRCDQRGVRRREPRGQVLLYLRLTSLALPPKGTQIDGLLLFFPFVFKTVKLVRWKKPNQNPSPFLQKALRDWAGIWMTGVCVQIDYGNTTKATLYITPCRDYEPVSQLYGFAIGRKLCSWLLPWLALGYVELQKCH